jgi:hypothetical protein
LNELNKRQPKPMPADARRPSPNATRDNYRNQNGYAGAKKGQSSAPRPATSGGKGTRPAPKVQGGYAGATPDRAKSYERPTTVPSAKPSSRDAQRPQSSSKSGAGGSAASYQGNKPQGKKPQGDRGYGGQQAQRPQPQNRPAPSAKPQPQNRPAPSTSGGGGGGNRGSAVSGANRGGNADRQASQRGKQSMPQGAKSKGGGGKQRQGR